LNILKDLTMASHRGLQQIARSCIQVKDVVQRSLTSHDVRPFQAVPKHVYSTLNESVGNQGANTGKVGVMGLVAAGLASAAVVLQGQQTRCSGPGVRAGTFRADLPTYSKDDVAKHTSKDSGIWVTFKDGVYDVTQWADIHPGGAEKLMLAAGGAIDPFWAMYAQHNTEQVQQILEEYRIGNLEGGAVPVEDPYANEPTDRHPALGVRSKNPMNAETPMELLGESLITPNNLFYIRNHLPVPDIDKSKYDVQVAGDGVKHKSWSVDDLKSSFKKHSVVATIQCTGNRRKDLLDSTCGY